MWLEWLNYLLSQPNVPQTTSLSYGVPERILPLKYPRTLCNLFARTVTPLEATTLHALSSEKRGVEDMRDVEDDQQTRMSSATSQPA